jgi:hypothetical protein
MRTIPFEGESGKPVTAYFDNDTRIIERTTQPVHWRKDEDNPTCPACGGVAAIWLARQSNHTEHPARCTLIVVAEKQEAA